MLGIDLLKDVDEVRMDYKIIRLLTATNPNKASLDLSFHSFVSSDERSGQEDFLSVMS